MILGPSQRHSERTSPITMIELAPGLVSLWLLSTAAAICRNPRQDARAAGQRHNPACAQASMRMMSPQSTKSTGSVSEQPFPRCSNWRMSAPSTRTLFAQLGLPPMPHDLACCCLAKELLFSAWLSKIKPPLFAHFYIVQQN